MKLGAFASAISSHVAGKNLVSRVLTAVTWLLVSIVLAVYAMEHWDTGIFSYDLSQAAWFQVARALAGMLMFVNLGALAWRAFLFKTYKPIAACEDKDLPAITVLVPAYNEGAQVVVTLKSVCASDYPAEKMQVIAIDDGSKDDTWEWMLKAKEELGDRVEIIKQPKNGGKRHALYTGFKKATGLVWVTIDSDSVVEPWGLRNLISPFVRDARVGGVGGNVRVLNYKEGFIPKLLEVAFTFGFDFVRATHSRVNTVMCTPGALSAFRASAVRPIMDEWLNEQFLGKPYNIGEDRNLTNLVLRQGFHVLFQSNANVFTNVPTTYKGLCKMLLRWARSDVRESMILSGFAVKRFRPTSMAGARLNLLLSWIDMLITQPVLVAFVLSFLFIPLGEVFKTLFFVGLGGGAIPVLVYFWRHRSLRCLWGIPYAAFYFLALSWIQFYAVFTVHRSGWLTRQLPMEGEKRSLWRLVPMYATAAVLGMVIISTDSAPNRDVTPALNDNKLIALVRPAYAADMLPSSATSNYWWYLAAKTELGKTQDGRIQLGEVELVVTRHDGSNLRLVGESALYCPQTHQLVMHGKIQGATDDGMIFVVNDSIQFSYAKSRLDTTGEVLVQGPFFDIKGRGMRFDLADNRAYFTQIAQDIAVAPAHSSRVLATLGSSRMQ